MHEFYTLGAKVRPDPDNTMYTISKSFSFCYGHRLFGDEGKCRNLHGHSAKTVIFIEAESLNKNGMVCHFDKLKETIGKWISENLDHTMLLSQSDPITAVLKKNGERVFVMKGSPTAENIAKIIYDKAKTLEKRVACVEVWESGTAKASYTRRPSVVGRRLQTKTNDDRQTTTD